MKFLQAMGALEEEKRYASKEECQGRACNFSQGMPSSIGHHLARPELNVHITIVCSQEDFAFRRWFICHHIFQEQFTNIQINSAVIVPHHYF